jgi:NAD(P)-dependent dehydrogenase (short-subunit alcohol dehydrogenase family)
MKDRLQNKVAIVFGAGSIGPGRGNGQASAALFDANGANVICFDINLTAAVSNPRSCPAVDGGLSCRVA